MEDRNVQTGDVTVTQKATRLNRDTRKYGSIAEIGAGQEIARWFFYVGGAAGTVAKTVSAYDMKLSDEFYGPCSRYVSRQRLYSMLDYEYNQLVNTLRSEEKTFFAFANTVAASSFQSSRIGEGWLGIRFQTEPHGEPNDIIIHVRLFDKDNKIQQKILGVLGVNFIYGAMFYAKDPTRLIASLIDDIEEGRVEIDLIKFAGPCFNKVDNRLMSFALLQKKLTRAIVFSDSGEIVQASEFLYKKPLMIERGTFRPVTNVALNLLEVALKQYSKELHIETDEPIVLMEITTRNWGEGSEVDIEDFLARIEMLQSLNKRVLVSNYRRDFRLVAYLAHYTNQQIGIAMGIPHLRQIFREDFYTDLEGGILESFGKLFQKNVKLYIYPMKDRRTGRIITAETLEVPHNLRYLYQHMLENGFIESIEEYDRDSINVFPKEVVDKIQQGDPSWKDLVPAPVADIILAKGYFLGDDRLAKAAESHFETRR
ncbi:hypothetical protein JYU14_01035 [Simkania negevensis]|uniref:TonB-dependent receptor n=1 Tax=Simkania negevensis TaxID=83561 RepID=A0ABS3APN5_9BACT|nr:hypothetical protein [Simkania negevensis]